MKKIETRLEKKYYAEVYPVLKEEFNIKNSLAVPCITKIVVNSGIGFASKSKENIESLSSDMARITGQKPAVRMAKVSVASFGIRRGMPVGLKVTLRRDKMYDFLDRLVSIVLPRLRDFRGVSLNSFDKSGNYTIAVKEHNVFPELEAVKVVKPIGFEITIVIKAKNIEESKRLLELMGVPFVKI